MRPDRAVPVFKSISLEESLESPGTVSQGMQESPYCTPTRVTAALPEQFQGQGFTRRFTSEHSSASCPRRFTTEHPQAFTVCTRLSISIIQVPKGRLRVQRSVHLTLCALVTGCAPVCKACCSATQLCQSQFLARIKGFLIVQNVPQQIRLPEPTAVCECARTDWTARKLSHPDTAVI